MTDRDREREALIEEAALAQRAIVASVLQETAFPTLLGFDMSMAQLKGIVALTHTRVCTISQLAERLHSSRPATSLLVDRLVADGLVERERAEGTQDRRRTLIRLSRRGEQLLSQLRQGREEHNPLLGWLAKLSTQDLQALVQGLRALAAETYAATGVSDPLGPCEE